MSSIERDTFLTVSTHGDAESAKRFIGGGFYRVVPSGPDPRDPGKTIFRMYRTAKDWGDEIRKRVAAGESQLDLAQEFNISQSIIFRTANGTYAISDEREPDQGSERESAMRDLITDWRDKADNCLADQPAASQAYDHCAARLEDLLATK